MNRIAKRGLSVLLALMLALGMLPGLAGVAFATQTYENWNGQHEYGELKRFVDNDGKAWFNNDGTDAVSWRVSDYNTYGTAAEWYFYGKNGKDDHKYDNNYTDDLDTKLDFDVYVPSGSVVPPARFRFSSIGYESGVKVVFDNDTYDMTELCKDERVKVNSKKLTFNSNHSYTSGLSAGQYIRNGTTIYFLASELNEGENTVTFIDPDGKEHMVYVKKTTTEGNWNVSYTIEKIDAPSPTTCTVTWMNGDTELETDENVAIDTKPSYNGEVPVKTEDNNNTYTFSGWSTSRDATVGTAMNDLPNVTESVTYHAIFSATPKVQQKTLYVRLKGSFDNMIVGQSINDGVDTVSSASTGGGGSYAEDEAPVYVEYALADSGTEKKGVSPESWKRPDYFKNGNELTIDGTQSKNTIRKKGGNSETNDSGLTTDFNPWSGGLKLKGKATTDGTYEVVVTLVDTQNRTDTSEPLEFKIYSGNETLYDQLKYENCTHTTQDDRYMFDNVPWYIKDFGNGNTVTVPEKIKAWYGSHGVAPTVNYGELGEVAERNNDGTVAAPTQTLIIPSGCNLTMVNMKVHSGVKIIVKSGGKLVLRQTTVDGIIEVERGGTFSMDYNDYPEGKWLHGSMVNGQIVMKDGSTLDHARITAHGNYLAECDNDNRRNDHPVVVTEGNVNIVGDVYILGENARKGETGQPALLVKGTLTVPEGATLACYGGGDSTLTAAGGDAIQLENGTITGAGNLIAVGSYAINLTSDNSKGKGGAAVSGNGTIDVKTAYLEGGSADENRGTPSEALAGSVTITDTTNCKLVTGSSTLGDTSPQYWHGTGDANGIVPDVQKTLALVAGNSAPAGVSTGRTGVKVTATWTDAKPFDGESVTAEVKERGGDTVRTLTLNANNNWTATTAVGLDPEKSYTVTAAAEGAIVEVTKGVQDDSWAVAKGNLTEGETYLITYQDDGKTYLLGAQMNDDNKTYYIGNSEWNRTGAIPDAFRWRPVKASEQYGWYLMNDGMEDYYLSPESVKLKFTK